MGYITDSMRILREIAGIQELTTFVFPRPRVGRASAVVPILVLVSLLTGGRGVAAQGVLDEARQANEQAKREYNLGHWSEAIEGFERAYKLTGDPALLFNIAQAQRQLGHGVEALRFYKAYLREKPVSPNREVAEKQVAELEALNRKDSFSPGPARPSGKSEGERAQPEESSSKGNAVAIPVVALASPKPEPILKPRLQASTVEDSQPTPAMVAVAHVQTSPASTDLPIPRWVVWAGAGATIALVTGAIATALSASSKYDSLKDSCGQTVPGCPDDQVGQVKTRDRVSTALWAIAGVVGVGTGVVVYVDSREAGLSALWRY